MDQGRSRVVKCGHCGEKSSIARNVTEFLCEHCGTEQRVRRRGGSVSFQSAFDDTMDEGPDAPLDADNVAAELEIRRLEDELDAMLEKRASLLTPIPSFWIKLGGRLSFAAGAACAFMALVTYLSAVEAQKHAAQNDNIVGVLDESSIRLAIFLVGALVFLAAALIIAVGGRVRATETPDTKLLDVKIEEITRRIAYKKASLR